MAYVPLDRFLVRAPLLTGPPFGDAAARLLRDPLGARALLLASPSLAARPTGAQAARALDRYGRRAAFRATPSGLLAGVAVGTLGARTGGATGRPRASLAPSWARVAHLGRALLDDPALRLQAHLRHAPSLLRGADRIRWLAFGTPLAEEREADLDARLTRILDACRDWAPWSTVREAATEEGSDEDDHADADADTDADGDASADTDELLLLLIDDGLLHHDLMPPLVGPPAAAWMAERLATLQPRPSVAQTLDEARVALDTGDLAAGRAALRALPGARRDGDGNPASEDDDSADGDSAETPSVDGAGFRDDLPDVSATLVHQPSRPLTLDRATVARAARLAPLLFRLQEALTPPAAERLADGAARDALADASELFGEGALDAAAWALGEYGVDPGASDDDPGQDPEPDRARDGGEPRARARIDALPPPALLRWLVDELAAARAEQRPEIALDAATLDRLLPGAAPPPTCELFLTPTAGRSGWLLGLHAPAGASWGRFASALGPAFADAFTALDSAERAAHPGQRRLDVAFAPSEALADLCAHAPVRARQLALSTWPARGGDGDHADADADTRDDHASGRGEAVVAARLDLVAAPGLDAAAIADADDLGAGELVPSPLARVRSTTAPPGLFRLLAGFSLYRQHAPWALSLGALADLAYVPRVSIDGFVISPASWRLPRDLDARALRRWRRAGGAAAATPAPPRFVQVGAADELLPVDLDAPQAWRDLSGQPRAWEIWPPLDRTVDRDRRRIEAVVALVDFPDAAEAVRGEARQRAIAGAGAVPPPRLGTAASGWRTFALHGIEQHQDDVLLDAVAPAVREAIDAGEIDHWFFLRYADDHGRRPHLRLRVHAANRAHGDAFAARLDLWLQGARTSGAVVLVESGAYHPEVARFGGRNEMAAALRIFQQDSELACALLENDRTPGDPDAAGSRPDLVDRLVVAFDSLAAGLGLALPARHDLARRRRHAEAEAATDPGDGDRVGNSHRDRRAIDGDFRARAPGLRAALSAPAADDRIAQRLAAHRAQVSAAVEAIDDDARARIAAPLLHLGAVRLLGADRAAEARAYLFWERTLEGLLRSPPLPGPARARKGQGKSKSKSKDNGNGNGDGSTGAGHSA